MFKQFRNAFIAGLVLLAPLGVTIFVINILRNKIGAPVSDLIFRFLETPTWLEPILQILSIIIVCVFITALGFLSNYFLGKAFVRFAENIINAVPFVNTVYKTVKQIVETFSKQQKAVFQQVVIIEYPRKNVYVMGFLTSKTKGEIQSKVEGNLLNVFVPTTPNPTSGFLLMVPEAEVTLMDMSVGDGMKLIVSGGAVTPPHNNEGEATPEALPESKDEQRANHS